MIVYDRSAEHDALLVNWYHDLVDTRDMHYIFAPRFHSLAAFLAFFQPPTALMLEVDGARPWFAVWLCPWMDGLVFSVWVAAGRRGTKRHLVSILTAVEIGLSHRPVLVVFTRNEKRLATYANFGVKFMGGQIPYLIDGQAVYVGHLTRESFEKRRKGWPREVAHAIP